MGRGCRSPTRCFCLVFLLVVIDGGGGGDCDCVLQVEHVDCLHMLNFLLYDETDVVCVLENVSL